MAVYKIFPTKDASIYSEYPVMNTGLDSVLECSTYVKDQSGQTSRYLVQYNQTEIANLFSASIGTASFAAYFRAYHAYIDGLSLTSSVELYPVSESWGMGTGHYGDTTQVTNGVSWEYRSSSGSNAWATSSFGAYATASFDPLSSGGGVWFTGSSLGLEVIKSQSFAYANPFDLKVDVTSVINTWNSGGLPNNGFLIKQQSENEFILDPAYTTTMKFFSVDTHTIYPPHLEMRWDDYVFNTGSSTNSIIATQQAFISLNNNVGTYYSESVQKFRLTASPKYPTRTFSTSSIYNTNYYLPPSSSLYAIKDADTNEIIVDFDSTYTKISADATGSYFTVYMNGLEPERYYTILIKTVIDGSTIIFDEDLIFKVSN